LFIDDAKDVTIGDIRNGLLCSPTLKKNAAATFHPMLGKKLEANF